VYARPPMLSPLASTRLASELRGKARRRRASAGGRGQLLPLALLDAPPSAALQELGDGAGDPGEERELEELPEEPTLLLVLLVLSQLASWFGTWAWMDSNHRPHPYQGCALTA